MKCPIETQENAELLLAYTARKLDLESTLILERHMQVCPACRRFQESQQAVWEALDAWEAPPVPAHFDERLYERIEREVESSWWRRLTRPMRPVLVRRGLPIAAAAACLAIMAGVLLEHPRNVIPANEQPKRVEAVRADQVERTLEDIELLNQLNAFSRSDAKSASAI